MDVLPLNTSGKIDRKKLPEINIDQHEQRVAYVPPQTKLEREIAEIWREVLKVEAVGLDDNFFDLGGHSLLMTKAHMRLQEILKQEFSIVEMFSHPTIRLFANYLGQNGKESARVDMSYQRANKQIDAIQRRKKQLRSIAQQRSMQARKLNQERKKITVERINSSLNASSNESKKSANGNAIQETGEDSNLKSD